MGREQRRGVRGTEDKQNPYCARLSLVCFDFFNVNFFTGVYQVYQKKKEIVSAQLWIFAQWTHPSIQHLEWQIAASCPTQAPNLLLWPLLWPWFWLSVPVSEMNEHGTILQASFVSGFLLFNVLFVGFIHVGTVHWFFIAVFHCLNMPSLIDSMVDGHLGV